MKSTGSLISDGNLIQSKESINVHFAIDKHDRLLWGYLPKPSDKHNYKQMVGGVIWLVRNGKNFVKKSEIIESSKTIEGNMTWFTHTQSARTVIGNDQHGRFVIMQIDGKTNLKGLDSKK